MSHALKFVLPAVGALAAIATANPELLGFDAAAAGAGGAADVGALASDTGLAAALNAAPDIAGGVTGVTEAALPLAASAPALAGDISGGLDLASSLNAAPDIAGGVTGVTQAATPLASTAPALAGDISGGLDLASSLASSAGTTLPSTGDLAGGIGTVPGGAPNLMASLTASTPGATTPAAAGGTAGAGALPGGVGSAGATAASPAVAAIDPAAGIPGVGGDAGAAAQDFSGGTAAFGAPSAGTDTGGGGLTGWLSQNKDWIGPAASAGGLGLAAIRDLMPLPGTNQIASAAAGIPQLQAAETAGLNNVEANATGLASQGAALTTQGAELAGYLQSGTLPPGIQQSVTAASNQAKASIRSMYASRGQSGSSAEAEDLAAVDQNAVDQGTQIAQQLLTTGINEQATGTGEQQTALNTQLTAVNDALTGGVAASGLTANLYELIMNNTLQQSQALGSAIGNFASSLVPRVQINAT